ncbi:uncharacterized protein LOC126366416 [Pectinophora gossypiella]|uniref:uncharacterized protein LOC126366416 n=1 Tax=Pectinophora gossypiella TaxID=13191 RepID=UPI00214E95CB|nr:uncharacterized protein LOC126366416 [Pectinophora gossypiella]
MPEPYDPNALWVAISEFGEGNLFQVYPKLLAEILSQDDAARIEGDTSEAEKLVLPSDKEFRLHNYFNLVAMQKALEVEETSNVERPVEEPVEEWAPWNLVVPTKNPNAPPPVAVRTSPGPEWDIMQVLKAARLLFKPPMSVDFRDEQEMRSVYSIIYDVFRYKIILDQAIEDVEFFGDYPLFSEFRQSTWLFLMELARRRWAARPRGEQDQVTEMLERAGYPFREIESAVWDQRVHFAAAIARIRIKNKAFSLSDLLPAHLREERVMACVHKETVTGWVNTFKAKKVASLVKRLHELGYSYSSSRQLCAGEYRFDRVCPRFITLRPPPDISIGQLDLVKDGVIVLQEREFCEGASTLCRALRVNELRGVVAQTHASSPRSSAYLAAQLRELAAVLRAKTPAAPATPELGKLVVFGAGDKVESYVESLRHLGIDASVAPESNSPVCVYSEPVHCETPNVTSALDGVVAVLATPPNSYSSVTDPIDLVCGRGGDLAMLEILTESEINHGGKERVQSILEEQKKTLKTLLSKPQIQLILYETHSALEAENQAQVTRAVAEANRLARERHALLKKKPKDHAPHSAKAKDIPEVPFESLTSMENTISRSDIEKDDVEEMSVVEAINRSEVFGSPTKIRPLDSNPGDFVLKKRPDSSGVGSRPGTNKARPIPTAQVPENNSVATPRDPDKDSPDVPVPNCDLFEIGALPNLGNGLDINYILDRDGCYLGLIQRKEITRLDAKYMIRVAEERGLFGQNPTPAPQRRKKHEPATTTPRRRRRKTSGFEVERVAAPTYASIVRSCRRGSAPAACLAPLEEAPGSGHVCEKHARRQAAASALVAAACACDARHRTQIRGRRASLEAPRACESPRGPPPACRRPFPLAVHDLQLRTGSTHHKVFAS